MRLKEFISSLLPMLHRDSVEDLLKALQKNLTTSSIPVYKTAVDHYRQEKFKDRDVIAVDRQIQSQVRNVKGRNHLEVVYTALTNLNDSITRILAICDKELEAKFSTRSLTYRQSNLLRVIELATFVEEYSRMHLRWVYHRETLAAGREDHAPFVPAMVEYFQVNRTPFIIGLDIVGIKPSDLEKRLLAIPDLLVIPEEIEVAEQTLGKHKLTMVSSNLIPPKLNPAFHVGMWQAERAANAFHRAQEDRQSLEFRLMNLREIAANEPADALRDREIAAIDEKINKLSAKMAKLSE